MTDEQKDTITRKLRRGASDKTKDPGLRHYYRQRLAVWLNWIQPLPDPDYRVDDD